MTNSTQPETSVQPESESPSIKTQRKLKTKSSSLAKIPSKVLAPVSEKLPSELQRPKSGVPVVRNKKQEVLRRLGLEPEQMVGVPRITFQLEHAEGGLEQVIEALRGSDEQDAKAFIRKYDSCSPSDLEKLTIEEVATAAGIPTIDLLGVATKALFEQSQTVAGVIAASAHHKVVAKSVQMALQDKGVRDREMIHTATGFLPAPKGTVIFNNRTQVANFGGRGPSSGHEGAIEGEALALPPASPSLEMPTMDDDVLGMQEAARKLSEAK